MNLLQMRATAATTTVDVFPAEAPTYLGVKRTSRARKFEVEFRFDAEVSAQRGAAWYWMILRDGNHTVGLFSRDTVRDTFEEARAAGEVVLTSYAGA